MVSHTGPAGEVADLAAHLEVLEPKLRRALVARYGREVGSEASADAVAWAWEHRGRLATVDNLAGYLYRVGQSSVRRGRRAARAPLFPEERSHPGEPELPGDVFQELARLKPEQRVAVLLVHGYGFSYRDVAELLDVSEAAVTNYVHRGMKRLRSTMEKSS